mmetsp:Transcript_12279/g.36937  ORF Transcript_12279/g.36937 Transcript_12279/m.36937 type:complete len:238 (+) Transcript_12279:1412-2125(+)
MQQPQPQQLPLVATRFAATRLPAGPHPWPTLPVFPVDSHSADESPAHSRSAGGRLVPPPVLQAAASCSAESPRFAAVAVPAQWQAEMWQLMPQFAIHKMSPDRNATVAGPVSSAAAHTTPDAGRTAPAGRIERCSQTAPMWCQRRYCWAQRQRQQGGLPSVECLPPSGCTLSSKPSSRMSAATTELLGNPARWRGTGSPAAAADSPVMSEQRAGTGTPAETPAGLVTSEPLDRCTES